MGYVFVIFVAQKGPILTHIPRMDNRHKKHMPPIRRTSTNKARKVKEEALGLRLSFRTPELEQGKASRKPLRAKALLELYLELELEIQQRKAPYS